MLTRKISSTFAALLLTACSGAPPPAADDTQFTQAEETVAPTVTNESLHFLGAVQLSLLKPAVVADSIATDSPVIVPDPLKVARLHAALDQITARRSAAQLPTALPLATASAVSTATDGALFGFSALSIVDSDTASRSTGFVPPDQGLCAGNGFVIEMVNDAFAIYDVLGQPVIAPVDNAAFFRFPPESASFPTDPKCYFDPATQRFFATILRVDFNPDTSVILGSQLAIAVSQTADPRGAWNVFQIEATDDGTNGSPNHPHCPCLGDQPLIGADTNGFYVTTNEFPLESLEFNGAQIYAMSKTALEAGNPGAVVHLANLVLADGIGYSLQPATTPDGMGPSEAGGTEYFLSALDFGGSIDDRIALWGLSQTRTLGTLNPSVKVEHVVLRSETYGFPPPAAQKPGPTPLRDCLTTGTCPGISAPATANPIEPIETNDDRMNQVFLSDGALWSALNTVVDVGGEARAGIAWFGVTPRRLESGKLGARMRKQGYVAVANNDVSFPSVVVDPEGRGAMTFAISGADFFPSAAYVRFDATHGPGDVRIAAAGAAPLDDWDPYAPPVGVGLSPIARYGDYSAALLDGETLWMGQEYVPTACPSFPCAGRDELANWGTFVSRIDLADTLDR